jgi:hypothetical protein
VQSERVRPVPPLLEPLRSLPLVLTCLFVAVAAVDAVVALQPGWLSALRSRWQQALPAGASPWATLSAAAVIIGGVAVAASILVGFIRGVRAAPYLSLAPLWVGSCMLVIGRLPFELPLPLPPPAFIASCALVFVGGGVLFERRALLWNALGVVLCLLPPGLLALGYGLAPGAAFDGNAALLLLVVVLAAAGAPIIAIAGRVHGTRLGPITAEELDVHDMLAQQDALASQVTELAQRARDLEDRALRAERQLAVQPAWQPAVPRLALQADELTPALALRRSSSWYSWIAPVLLAFAAAAAFATYALLYLPLQAELASQQQQNALQAEAQSDAIAAVRAGYERERQALELQLTAAKASLAEQTAAQPTAEPASVSQEDEKRAAREAKREAARVAHEERAAELQAAREARSAAREERNAQAKAAREDRPAERKPRLSEAAKPTHEAGKPVEAAQPAPPPREALDADNDDPLGGL